VDLSCCNLMLHKLFIVCVCYLTVLEILKQRKQQVRVNVWFINMNKKFWKELILLLSLLHLKM
jgi:hypothetical protein